MAILSRLEISDLRNISSLVIAPSKHCNVIYGANGSGKTSLLESIHLLGVGRSFRGVRLEPLIQNGTNECTVFAELVGGASIGVTKSRNRKHTLKLRGEKQKNWEEVARCLPVQIINSETFLLLEGSPKVRRRFLDWGVFHVEPRFLHSWRRAQQCLQNRNFLLKEQQLDIDQLKAWDRELVIAAEEVAQSRQKYFSQLIPVFEITLSKLLKIDGLEIVYQKGWDAALPFEDVLERNLLRDQKYKSTQQGPHRADLVMKVGQNAAVDVLSRGQQKMLVSALKIAQGQLLNSVTTSKSIYLVDDLPSELDKENRTAVFELLAQLDCQVFLTCVDKNELENYWSDSSFSTTFHVKHGKITP